MLSKATFIVNFALLWLFCNLIRDVSFLGGQKARVILTRAVYARAKYILLDDPLSAVMSFPKDVMLALKVWVNEDSAIRECIERYKDPNGPNDNSLYGSYRQDIPKSSGAS